MKTANFVKNYLKEHLDPKYVYHNLTHTEQVAAAVEDIGNAANLEETEIELLKTAAWFHDIGYCKNWEKHEELGVEIARTFLEKENYSEEQIASISNLILATKFPHNVKTFHEKIIADADLSHLGSNDFIASCSRLRMEYENTGRKKYDSEIDWLKMEIRFLENYAFHTSQAQELYDKGRLKNLKEVKEQLKKLENA